MSFRGLPAVPLRTSRALSGIGSFSASESIVSGEIEFSALSRKVY
jgi:hypothetical protein